MEAFIKNAAKVDRACGLNLPIEKLPLKLKLKGAEKRLEAVDA
jgi:hypothetical protein